MIYCSSVSVFRPCALKSTAVSLFTGFPISDKVMLDFFSKVSLCWAKCLFRMELSTFHSQDLCEHWTSSTPRHI